MKKKTPKAVPNTVISPSVPQFGSRSVEDLCTGDKFLYNGRIYMLFDEDSVALDLETCESVELDYGTKVVPVTVVINWTKK